MPPLEERTYLRSWEVMEREYGEGADDFYSRAMTSTHPKAYKVIDRLCRKLKSGRWVTHGETYRAAGEDQLLALLAIHRHLHPLEQTEWFEPDDYGGVGGLHTSAVRLAGPQLLLW